MTVASDHEVTKRLDTLIRLAAVGLMEGKSQTDQIRVLSKAGLQPKDIAELVGTTSNNVRVRLVALRKGAKKSGRQ